MLYSNQIGQRVLENPKKTEKNIFVFEHQYMTAVKLNDLIDPQNLYQL